MDDAGQADQIEEVVMPVLRDHGRELVDIEWRPLRPRGVPRLFVDKPGGVGVGDCQRNSREDGHAPDATAIGQGPYDFEVSSAGLARVLHKQSDFRWAVSKRVRW